MGNMLQGVSDLYPAANPLDVGALGMTSGLAGMIAGVTPELMKQGLRQHGLFNVAGQFIREPTPSILKGAQGFIPGKDAALGAPGMKPADTSKADSQLGEAVDWLKKSYEAMTKKGIKTQGTQPAVLGK